MGSRGHALGFGFAAILCVVTAFSCARRVPGPSFSKQPTDALVEVPYPPPPGRVEFVPDTPNEDAVWVDGEWTWQGRRWAWKRGRWVLAPPNASYSPWTAVRNANGTLYVAEGVWRDAKGVAIADPPVLAQARPTRGDVVTPEGENVKAGVVRSDRSADAGSRDASIPAFEAGTQAESRDE